MHIRPRVTPRQAAVAALQAPRNPRYVPVRVLSNGVVVWRDLKHASGATSVARDATGGKARP